MAAALRVHHPAATAHRSRGRELVCVNASRLPLRHRPDGGAGDRRRTLESARQEPGDPSGRPDRADPVRHRGAGARHPGGPVRHRPRRPRRPVGGRGPRRRRARRLDRSEGITRGVQGIPHWGSTFWRSAYEDSPRRRRVDHRSFPRNRSAHCDGIGSTRDGPGARRAKSGRLGHRREEVRSATGVTVWTLPVDLGDRDQAAALAAVPRPPRVASTSWSTTPASTPSTGPTRSRSRNSVR